MPDSSPESLLDEALKRISAEEQAPQAGILPSQTQVQRELGVPQRQVSFSERNYAGFPIDLTSGVPASVRYNLARQPTEEEKLGYLNSIYGAGSARKADTGEFLVRIPDVTQTKRFKDVLVNEQGITGGDIAALGAHAPETFAALAAMYGGRQIPRLGAARGLVGFERDVLAGAVGQEAGGAAQDIATRLQYQPEVNLAEIGARRLGQLPFDVAFANALGAGGAMLGKVVTPIGPGKDIVGVEGRQAAQELERTTGERFPMTVGEVTGAPAFKRIEATMGQLPGSSKYFSQMVEQKTSSLRRMMNKIMGLPEGESPAALPSAEQVGEEAVAALKANLTPAQEAIESARNTTLKEVNDQILNTLEASAPGARQLYPERVGASIRQAAYRIRDDFRTQSSALYEEALSLPGGRDRIFQTPQLANRAKQLIKELPPVTKEAEQVAYDAYGNPIAATVKTTGPSKEFVPDSVVGKLKELADNPKTERSLNDLIQMRSEVDNAIAEGEAIPGRQTRYLSQIREALTGAIGEATADNPALKSAFEKANTFYRENVSKFHQRDIARLFKEIDQPGFVKDEQIVRKIGPTEYETFKKFLGKTSPEFQQLKRSIVDDLILDSTPLGENLVQGKAFIKSLSMFIRDRRAIADDMGLSGAKAGDLQRLGEILNAADVKVDADALKKLIVSGEPIEGSVKKLVAEQANLDKLYRSKILKQIGEGTLGEGFNAGDFVNRFYDSASPKEIQAVISQLADRPETLESLRRKLIQKVLFDAQRSAKVVDNATLGPGDPLLPPNSDLIRKAVGDVDRRKNLETILGKQTYDQVINLAKVSRMGEASEQAFRSAGGIMSGMQVSDLVHGGLLSYAGNYVKQRFAAIVMASPILRTWVSNATMKLPLTVGGVELAKTRQGALVTTLIGSTPFLEAVSDELGQGTAANQFITALRRAVNMYEQEQAKPQAKPSAEQLLDQRIFKIQQGQ